MSRDCINPKLTLIVQTFIYFNISSKYYCKLHNKGIVTLYNIARITMQTNNLFGAIFSKWDKSKPEVCTYILWIKI